MTDAQALIATLREARWTRSAIAKRLRVSRETIHQWDAGLHDPQPRNLADLRALVAEVEHAERRAAPEPDAADDDPCAVLERRWRARFEVIRQQRDWALMLVAEFEHRLAQLEARVGIESRRSPVLDSLTQTRVLEAVRGPAA